jgi:uncharacterized delta-60 repeat protein
MDPAQQNLVHDKILKLRKVRSQPNEEEGVPSVTASPFPPAEYDASFGANGKLLLGFNGVHAGWASNIVECKTLKQHYLATIEGYHTTSVPNIGGIARFDQNGNLDTSFGNQGTGILEFRFGQTDGYCTFTGIEEREDGSIFVWGSYERYADKVLFYIISKIAPDGSPDESFGTNGHCRLDLIASVPLNLPSFECVVINSDGSLNVACRKPSGSSGSPLIIRITPDGLLDKKFQKEGFLEVTFGGPGSTSLSGIIHKDSVSEGILAYGFFTENRESFGFLKMFNRGGVVDSGFGTNGTAIFPPEREIYVNSLFASPDGKQLIAAGMGGEILNLNSFLWKYDLKGNPDLGFNEGEAVTHDFGTTADVWGSAMQRDDGKVIAIGSGYSLEEDWTVIGRFLANGQPDDTYGGELHFCTPPNATEFPVGGTSMLITGPQQVLFAGRYNGIPAVFAVKV